MATGTLLLVPHPTYLFSLQASLQPYCNRALFHYVKLSDIYNVNHIHDTDLVQWQINEWGAFEGNSLHVERKIFKIQIYGRKGGFTAVSYDRDRQKSMELLRTDIVFLHLTPRLPFNGKMDRRVVQALRLQLPDLKNYTIAIQTSINSVIAVGARFTLKNDSKYFYFKLFSQSACNQDTWPLQTVNVFCKHGISPDRDLSEYTLIMPNIHMEGSISESEVECKH
ncbi:hypothetical protein L218DRAFT_946106 [Marasmius fiardii PR-910]|nr:hypothetical protein L218DRAFT_946106 [Marasmius fiardii PR-910]